MGLVSGGAKIYASYQFVRELTKSWDKTEAFKTGVIDDKGVVIVNKRLRSKEQKASYDAWNRLVYNVKRLFEKIPGGKSNILKFAAALWLLREHKDEVNKVWDDTILECMNEEPTMVIGPIAKPDVLLSPDERSCSNKRKQKKCPHHLRRKKIENRDKDMTENDDVVEGKKIKRVVRGGIRKKIVKCTNDNQKVVGGKCVTKTSKDKLRYRKASKKRNRSMKGKSQARRIKKMLKSTRKRGKGMP